MNWISQHPETTLAIAYVVIGVVGNLLSESNNKGLRILGHKLEALAFDASKAFTSHKSPGVFTSRKDRENMI